MPRRTPTLIEQLNKVNERFDSRHAAELKRVTDRFEQRYEVRRNEALNKLGSQKLNLAGAGENCEPVTWHLNRYSPTVTPAFWAMLHSRLDVGRAWIAAFDLRQVPYSLAGGTKWIGTIIGVNVEIVLVHDDDALRAALYSDDQQVDR